MMRMGRPAGGRLAVAGRPAFFCCDAMYIRCLRPYSFSPRVPTATHRKRTKSRLQHSFLQRAVQHRNLLPL